MKSQTRTDTALAVLEQAAGDRASAGQISSPQKKKQRREQEDVLMSRGIQLDGEFREDSEMSLEDQLIEPFILDQTIPTDNRCSLIFFPPKEQEWETTANTQMGAAAGIEPHEQRAVPQNYSTSHAEARSVPLPASPLQMEGRSLPATLEAHTNLDNHYIRPLDPDGDAPE